ncbi:DUF3289 family protein [Serratia rubidaea]|uniref:DUF3289 family protein n=1 Tax=Serratia rubidaea TaxID=61652 RepID=A0A3S5AKW1_SERRU|nr:YPO3983 family protein [Serratia rubidaea]MBH1930512.1 DUF3289 family protein [Serratia rubidaea]MDC6117613.1 DUF3289 family protein [Serratia rubidaea]MEB7586011.1 DUF3289 family protein [Serratia rubidaea]VEI65805.1 Protein of uncharacterised function (DUF3289) [Serratia rubidaea]
MTALTFPCTVFETQKRMDDYGAADMRSGDLTSGQLKTQFRLTDVSTRVDPYTLRRSAAFGGWSSMFRPPAAGAPVGRQECARILFDEFRELSATFALYGPYRPLIGRMINHMQYGNGTPFRDALLDQALKAHILNDKTVNSSLLKIRSALDENIDRVNGYFPNDKLYRIREIILEGRLPKFDRLQDNFNGMGITVHDTWATHITIKSLHIENGGYRVAVNYKVQDHFGLDTEDILKFKFNQFRFFRIWFVLQRYNQFGFKPFMTNMEADVELRGTW